MTRADYSIVTETPGLGATREQLAALYTRYRFAVDHVAEKDVLEVACGVGSGLGYLAERARRVVGGDLEDRNLAVARETYRNSSRVEIRKLDAEHLPFDDDSFDVLLLLEALYYLPHADRFLGEARRVLRPGGKLLISTVHPEWPGFNPSPHSTRYWTAAELHRLLRGAGFEASLRAAFPVRPASLAGRALNGLRQLAVRLRLLPRTMRGKQLLKRMFYGRLTPLPRVVTDELGPAETMVDVEPGQSVRTYKFLYATAENTKRRAA